MSIPMQPNGLAEPTFGGVTTIAQLGDRLIRVDIRVTGMRPNDDRAAQIHSPGSATAACDTGGPIAYPLGDVKADVTGTGTSSTTITANADGIPSAGWYVSVRQGAGSNAGPGVLCGTITNSVLSTAAQGPAVTSASPIAPQSAATTAALTAPNAPTAARGVQPAVQTAAASVVSGQSTTSTHQGGANGPIIVAVVVAAVVLIAAGFALANRRRWWP